MFKKITLLSLIFFLLAMVSLWPTSGALAQQVALPGNKIPQFIDPLPTLDFPQGSGTIETVIDTGAQFTLTMQEFKADVMPSTFVPAAGTYTGTYVWGYRKTAPPAKAGTYIGPVIVATRGQPTEIKFVNNLGTTTSSQLPFWKVSTDLSLHWANPKNDPMMVTDPLNPNMMIGNPAHYSGPIPAVPHLHGGEVPPVLDGGPDAWFLSSTATPQGYTQHGPAFYSKDGNTATNYSIYRYPNKQEAAMIWFHDHLLGATRLNVYAGIAGSYALTDPGLVLPTGLHPVGLSYATTGSPTLDVPIIPLVIQDRMFDTNGQLFFPNIGINPMDHPYWIPEFIGDTILVNGKVWPYKTVDRKRYRFLFLNGSNARTYDMSLIDKVSGVRGPRMWVIGTDGGYLDTPMLVDPNSVNKAIPKSLVMMPGERYDVIIDFNDPVWLGLINAAYPGGVPNPLNLILRNTAKAPYPGGAPAAAGTTGRIIQFRVSATAPAADNSYNPASGTALRTGTNPNLDNQKIVRLVNTTTGSLATGVTANKTRQLTLNEVMGMGGPLEILVNNTKWNGKRPDGTVVAGAVLQDVAGNWITEYPNEGHTEVWEIINLTADAHPIHLHLVQFQLINRQNFDVKGYNAAYATAFGGAYIPAFGPPYNYDNSNNPDYTTNPPLGGNPSVTPFLAAKKGVQIVTPPLPWEQGWKDTVMMSPGQVTRIAVRYAPTDKPIGSTTLYYPFNPNEMQRDYVWHCHIIDHEDNEMMRPYQVNPKAVERTYVQGTDY